MKVFLNLLAVLSLSLAVHAQDMGAIGTAACEGQGPDCQENIVTEGDLKNPASKGTMKLVSAGASLLYMGGVLNGVLKLPAMMGDVAKICISSGLGVAANLMAFMRARGNGKEIKGELKAIKDEAVALQAQLESEGFQATKEFQIEVFDFYMRAMERLQKVTQLRIKQHGQNSSLYSMVMAVGLAEAIFYSLPWSANPPMAKCGAKSAIFAGIALAMEKKGQKQAQKLLEEYQKRWQILADIKARLMMGTESLAKLNGDEAPDDRDTSVIIAVGGPDRGNFGPGRDWEAEAGGLSVSNYGCVNAQTQVDDSCACQVNNSCYKSTATGWNKSRYGAAFGSAGLDGYISRMNSAFAGKQTDPSSLSMADINARNANAARLRDRLLKDYADKENKAKKKNKLGIKIGETSDKELAAFLNSNFKRGDLDKMFSNNSDVFAGSEIDLGPGTDKMLGANKSFSESVSDKNASAVGNEGVQGDQSGLSGESNLDFGLASDGSLAAFDPKNIVLPKDANYDYIGQRSDIVRNNEVSLFDIISHRYQLIYREKAPEL